MHVYTFPDLFFVLISDAVNDIYWWMIQEQVLQLKEWVSNFIGAQHLPLLDCSISSLDDHPYREWKPWSSHNPFFSYYETEYWALKAFDCTTFFFHLLVSLYLSLENASDTFTNNFDTFYHYHIIFLIKETQRNGIIDVILYHEI